MSIADSLQGNVSDAAQQNIMRWLTEEKYAEYRDDVQAMIDAEQWIELEDAFFKVIEFGTGGRRGTTGVGSNRINKVTIGESAQALCEYAKSFDETAPQKGIVIACDTRLTSDELSKYAASVCAANGFTTYLFDGFRATPELSFAVRHLGAAAGIVISASHNPPADNGFKAYWGDGGQIVPPHDKGVLAAAEHVTKIHTAPFDELQQKGLITIIGADVDDAYYQAVLNEALSEARDLHIMYSPLHGAGQRSVLPVLERAGFTVSTVAEQMTPDGNFPTVPGGKANPEEKAANDIAVQQMLEHNADIAITNDPDADRIGVVVNQQSEAVYLNGNQSAVLAADFALKQLASRGELTEKHYVAKTIVTTDMLTALADHYGATMYTNMLVGFKYIGELIHQKETTDEVFVIGGEESYGLLKGEYARDKDGAAGALMLAEYAAELKAQGKTLYDRLFELYREHGIYQELLATVQLPGADGFSRMQAIMKALRDTPPAVLAGHEVSVCRDYASLTATVMATGETAPIDCASGNVLVFELGDARRRLTVRPSGTEPKLKFYLQWHDAVMADTDESALRAQYHELARELDSLMYAAEQQITALA